MNTKSPSTSAGMAGALAAKEAIVAAGLSLVGVINIFRKGK